MFKSLITLPLITRNGWTFRVSITDRQNFMIMVFGPGGIYLLRFFDKEEYAKAFIDEAVEGKHVE